MSTETPDPVAAVVWMIRGQWVSMCLRAGVELGLFDHLDEPATVQQLADKTSTDAPSLARLLRALEDLELVTARGNGRYAITPSGETLRTGHPSAVRELALMQTELPNLASWHSLADAVRRGLGVYEAVNGVTSWEHLSANPDQEAIFNAAMARRADLQAAAICSGCDLTGVSTVVDVGGGKGAMLTGLLAAKPHLSGIVADRPDVAAAASEAFASAGLADRARAVAADFFDSVPIGRDAYVLSNVLHDWADDDAISILRTVRAAMAPGARLWIVELVLDAPGRSRAQSRDLHLVDLHMLVLFGACERTSAEYDALLKAAGFGSGALQPTDNHWNVIEARPT